MVTCGAFEPGVGTDALESGGIPCTRGFALASVHALAARVIDELAARVGRRVVNANLRDGGLGGAERSALVAQLTACDEPDVASIRR